MSNAIEFLEVMGRNPALIQRSAEAYARSVAELDVDDGQRDALLSLDTRALGRLLNARSTMFCMISVPDQAPSRAPDDQDDDREPNSDDEPDKKE